MTHPRGYLAREKQKNKNASKNIEARKMPVGALLVEISQSKAAAMPLCQLKRTRQFREVRRGENERQNLPWPVKSLYRGAQKLKLCAAFHSAQRTGFPRNESKITDERSCFEASRVKSVAGKKIETRT